MIERYKEIDAIKGLSIIGVLFAHMSFKDRLNAEALGLIESFQISFGWCVLAFFFCSGFLTKVIPDNRELMRFIGKRFKRLFIPCIVFSWSYKVVLLILSKAGFLRSANDIPLDLSSWLDFLFMPVGPQFYFLYYLLLISILFAVLIRFCSIITASYIISASTLIAYFFLDFPAHLYGDDLSLFPAYFWGYAAGAATATLEDSFRDKKFLIWSVVLFLMIFLIYVFKKDLMILQLGVPFILWLLFRSSAYLSRILNFSKLGSFQGGSMFGMPQSLCL